MKTSFCAAAGVLAAGFLATPAVQATDPITAKVHDRSEPNHDTLH